MVISCPHALGLAAPLVVSVSTALAAKKGLLIRNRTQFEEARKLDAIIFDKTGKLRELKKKYSKVKAPKYKPADYEGIIFLAYHFTNCIERYLQSDPAAAFAGMHTNLTNLIEMRYRTVGRWQVSSKRLLKDLRSWDKPFSVLIEKFLKEADLNKKFKLWLVVKDYVLKPLGGARPVADLNCDCKSCSIYLKKVGELEQILT